MCASVVVVVVVVVLVTRSSGERPQLMYLYLSSSLSQVLVVVVVGPVRLSSVHHLRCAVAVVTVVVVASRAQSTQEVIRRVRCALPQALGSLMLHALPPSRGSNLQVHCGKCRGRRRILVQELNCASFYGARYGVHGPRNHHHFLNRDREHGLDRRLPRYPDVGVVHHAGHDCAG